MRFNGFIFLTINDFSDEKFNRMICAAYLSMIFLLLSGCDRVRSGNGILVDSNTKSPLIGVVAKSYGDKVDDDYYKSDVVADSSGRFTRSTGVPGARKNLIIVLSKDNYHSVTVKNPFNDTPYLYK